MHHGSSWWCEGTIQIKSRASCSCLAVLASPAPMHKKTTFPVSSRMCLCLYVHLHLHECVCVCVRGVCLLLSKQLPSGHAYCWANGVEVVVNCLYSCACSSILSYHHMRATLVHACTHIFPSPLFATLGNRFWRVVQRIYASGREQQEEGRHVLVFVLRTHQRPGYWRCVLVFLVPVPVSLALLVPLLTPHSCFV